MANDVVFVASFVVLSVSSYALLGTGGATWAFVATFVSFAVFVGSAVVKLRSRKGDRQRAAVRDERDA